MPNLRGWPAPPLYVPGITGPDQSTLRPCGCRIDPYVFGHADHIRKPLAGAA